MAVKVAMGAVVVPCVAAVGAFAASATALAFCEREAAFAVGAPADAVFFDRDPYEDPSVMERPIAVLRHGVRLR
jgi:hypothetical protein